MKSSRVPQKCTASAFTLIELLVVIAIIAVLAGILFPALARGKQAGTSTKCRSNVRQLALGLSMYVLELGFYPGHDRIDPRLMPRGRRHWSDSLGGYTASHWTNALYRCPDYKGYTVFRERFTGLGSYGYNGDELAPFSLDPEKRDSNQWLPDSKVKAPSDMVALGDVSLYATMSPSSWGADGPPRSTGNGILFHSVGSSIMNPRNFPWYIDALAATKLRHTGRLNVAFCDGHVESIKYEKLFADTDQARKRFNFDNEPHR